MDHKYLSNCQQNNYKASFFEMEDAINYVEDFKKDCRKRRMYCEEQYEITDKKTILVKLNVWESPEDNLKN